MTKFLKFSKATEISAVLFILLLNLCPCLAQNDSSWVFLYKDNRDYLYEFRNGVSLQVESQDVRSFSSKGDLSAYVDNGNNLIARYNNEKFELGDATATTYQLTNSLLIYKRDPVLAVFEKGKLTRLTYFIRDYQVNEGLITFRDQNIDMLRVYYKGTVTDLEYTLTGTMGVYKTGKNTVGYLTSNGSFKVFMEGETYEIDNVTPLDFVPGLDIVGYISGTSQGLDVIYNGKILTLENIKPQSMQAGDDLLAYVSDEGFFKIFDSGKLVKAESFPPDLYVVTDATVLFFTNNKLQVLQKGTRYELSEFKPRSYKMSNNRVAWQDQSGRLYFFSSGKTEEVSTAAIADYTLNGDILSYRLTDGTNHIWYKGKTY